MEKCFVSKEFYYNWFITDKQDNLNCIPSLIINHFDFGAFEKKFFNALLFLVLIH